MIDIKLIRHELEKIRANCVARGADIDVDAIAMLDRERRLLISKADSLRQQIKEVSKSWSSGENIERREEVKRLKKEESHLSRDLDKVERELKERLSWVPNLLDPRVPVGGEEANTVVRTVGSPPSFSFSPRPHGEIGAALDLLDIPRAVNAAKSRFYCLKNEAVLMRMGLMRMFYERANIQGFELISPPYLAKDQTLFCSGYLPFSEKENFRISGEDLSLIGTSEQILLGLHMDEMLTSLPKLYLGDSMCFRTEAGSYGRDTAGIIRVHQFYKLEQIVYCHPSESEEWHQRCLENAEWLMQELEIPFRVVLTSSGDLSAAGMIKYDTEAWLPNQARYREMTSDTNLGDYQTRRGNIRYKVGQERGFPHTISATGFCDRLIAVIIENYQEPDGSIVVPPPLVSHLNGMTKIKR